MTETLRWWFDSVAYHATELLFAGRYGGQYLFVAKSRNLIQH